MRAQHLIFRGNSYYYVARVPLDISRFFPVKIIWKSLKTNHKKSALVILRRLEYVTERLFMQIRSRLLTDDDIADLVGQYFHEHLHGGKRRQSIDERLPPEGAPLYESAKKRLEREKTSAGLQEISEEMQRTAAVMRRALAFPDHEEWVLGLDDLVRSLLTKNGLHSEKGSDCYQALERELLVAISRLHQVNSHRVVGDYDSDIERYSSQQYPKRKNGLMLSELIEKYSADRIAQKKWKALSTIKDMSSSYSLLLRVMGDFDISRADYEFARTFRERLRSFPANSNKGRFAKLTTEEMLALSDFSPMTVANVNKNLDRLAELYNWAIEKRLASNYNPFKGLKIDDDVPEADKRRCFTNREIQSIIQYLLTLLSTKLQSGDSRIAICIDYIWIFLIGLYTGLRSNEICQITVEDIFEDDEHLCLAVRYAPEEYKTTKNKQSRRVIPVPPQLLEMGLVDLVEARKAQNTSRLWRSVSLDSYGKWNRNFGRNINAYIDKALGGKDKSICFHSTRHNVSNALDDIDISLKTIQDIKGHASKSTTERTYLKKKLGKMYQALSQLDYGLDLMQLKTDLQQLQDLEDNDLQKGSSIGPVNAT